ncbi:MAG: BON domain-containing protein [Planctomycetes bacterium]|nr:BON domain-containing protein [Planctomycetota bacterium]
MRRLFLGMALSALAGLAPSGAMAADPETAQRIAQALRSSGRLSDYSIGVQYEDGTAWISGRVASQEQMQQAVSLASELPYVKQVVPALEIRPTKNVAEAGQPSQPRSLKQSTMSFLGLNNKQPQPISEPATGQIVAHQESRARTAGQPTMAAAESNYSEPRDPLAGSGNAQFAPTNSRRFATAPVTRGPAGQGRANGQVQQTASNIQAVSTPATNAIRRVPQGAQQVPVQQTGIRHHGYVGGGPVPCATCNGGAGGGMGGGAYGGAGSMGGAGAMSDQAHMPNYAWPSYAAYPNYAAVTYPNQYSAAAWPYIGPFYPYPQVPLGWRKVTLEWDDGWWFLDFKDKHCHH